MELTPSAAGRLWRYARAASAALDVLAGHVVLFRWGELVFVTFGLFAGLGALLALAWMGALLVGQGVAPEAFLRLALAASVAVVVGSWLGGLVLDWRVVLREPRVALRRPMFVSWGGLLGLCLTMAVLGPRLGVGVLVLLDAAARAVPLGHAFGRLGCLSYGCCFGRPTRGPLAITYHDPEAKAVRLFGLRHVPLHPTALYEAVLDVGLLVVANAAAAAGAPIGVPAALGFALYGLGRFAIEFLRDNVGYVIVPGNDVLPPLALNHFLSLGLVAIGGFVWATVGSQGGPAPAVSYAAAVNGAPVLLAAVAPAAAVVFLGFSVHRGRVGRW